MTSMPLFSKITILSLNLVNFRVSRFHVSHFTHETLKLRLQNTLNMSKTARVYFWVLHSEDWNQSATSFLVCSSTLSYVSILEFVPHFSLSNSKVFE